MKIQTQKASARHKARKAARARLSALPMTRRARSRRVVVASASSSVSAFDPTLPEDGALIIAGVLRDQMNALDDDVQTRATDAELASTAATLNADIQTRVTVPQLNTATNNAINSAIANTLPQTSSNSNGVSTLGIGAQTFYDQIQMQEVINKIDELINALRR